MYQNLSSLNNRTIGVKQALLWAVNSQKDKQPKPFLWKVNQPLCGWWWRRRPHCSLRSLAWLELRQGFHSSGALKMPMTPRLRTRLRTSTPIVPSKEGSATWVKSVARRDIMSAITPSIWKWVPTTALTWKSWWLWPAWQDSECETKIYIYILGKRLQSFFK